MILVSIPAWATTRYVDPVAGACTGNYSIASRNCTGSDGNSYATIALGLSPTAAGDTLYVRTGTYTTAINATGKAGTSLAYITIAGYPGETVTISVSGAVYPITRGAVSYVTYQNFVFDGVSTSNIYGLLFNSGEHHITFQDNEVKNFQRHGMLINGNGWIVRNNKIHDQSSTCVLGQRWYGIYVPSGDSIIIEHNEVYNNPGGGAQFYNDSSVQLTNFIARFNYFHDNNSCSNSDIGGVLVGGFNHGAIIHHNVITNNGSDAASGDSHGLIIQSGVDNVLALNNTIYGNKGIGIFIKNTGSVGSILQNNHVIGNIAGQISNLGASTTQTTNRSTGSITDCTPSTSVFTHKAGSSCINAGTIRSGYAYNGSAPDQGAFETFVFSSCQVTAAATSTIRASFTNNLFPPLLPASSVTGVTGRKNGANNAITASSRSATNQFDFTMTNSYVGGDTVDISASSTNITDSAAIGSTIGTAFYQPYVETLTNQSCANNAGGAPAYTYTQARYEFHSVDGTEAAPRMKPDGFASTGAAENFATLPVRKGGSVRLRFALVCGGADCPDTAFYIYYAQGGAYALVPDTFGAGNVATCGDVGSTPNSGTATTNQLSTAGTFVAGGYVNTSNAVPEIVGFLNGYKTENEYCVKFDTDASGTYTFRAYLQGGIALDTYTVTPTVTITESRMGAGF